MYGLSGKIKSFFNKKNIKKNSLLFCTTFFLCSNFFVLNSSKEADFINNSKSKIEKAKEQSQIDQSQIDQSQIQESTIQESKILESKEKNL
ncbi:MAG: hypothetical protein KR126chlam6_01557 [Candidatus Anoxychlamydiales bacterium]|nr:hypothetical protein [Candidatus Anoxychlamydiales bacterium]